MSSHHHHHGHAHSHRHDPGNGSKKRIAWAFFLNVGFTIIEFIGGLLTNSTAIMADAVHDLGDSLSIGMAWLLAHLSERDADQTFSYGFQRFSLLGSLINGLVLLLGSAWVLSEAIPRLANPEMPMAGGMFWLALFGIAVNGYAAYKLSDGKTLNERVLNWHLIEDVLGWVAVLIVAVVLMFFDLPILDPLLSIAFTLFILFNVFRALRDTVKLFLQANPDADLSEEIDGKLRSLNGICDLHHLHLWSLDGEKHVLTVHAVLEDNTDLEAQKALKQRISEALSEFELEHTTVEFEFPDEACRDG